MAESLNFPLINQDYKINKGIFVRSKFISMRSFSRIRIILCYMYFKN